MKLFSNGSINIGGNIINSNISSGRNLTVVQTNGRTIVNGRDITDLVEGELEKGVLKIVIEEGALVSVQSDCAVEAKNVTGNVEAGNTVRCGDVGGSVHAGNSVNCGKVNGSVRAGNSVNHR